MAAIVDRLLAQIQEREKKIREIEGQAVVLILEQARDLTRLRSKARKNWAKYLKNISFDPRVASRYLMIAKHWSNANQTPESDSLAKLPSDLLKLEWLCRLKKPVLKGLAAEMDLCQTDRGAVIRKVKDLLGETVEPKKITVKAIMKSWGTFRETLLTNLSELGTEDRQKFRDEIEPYFEEFLREMKELDEEDDDFATDDVNDDGKVSVGEDASDQQDDESADDAEAVTAEQEVPAQKAPPTRGNRSVGRRAKLQPA